MMKKFDPMDWFGILFVVIVFGGAILACIIGMLNEGATARECYKAAAAGADVTCGRVMSGLYGDS